MDHKNQTNLFRVLERSVALRITQRLRLIFYNPDYFVMLQNSEENTFPNIRFSDFSIARDAQIARE